MINQKAMQRSKKDSAPRNKLKVSLSRPKTHGDNFWAIQLFDHMENNIAIMKKIVNYIFYVFAGIY